MLKVEAFHPYCQVIMIRGSRVKRGVEVSDHYDIIAVLDVGAYGHFDSKNWIVGL